MTKKIVLYIILGLTIYISIILSVSAKENVVDFSYSFYSSALNNFPLNSNQYEKLKEYFNNYIKSNLNFDETYLLFCNDTGRLFLTNGSFVFDNSEIFKVNDRGLNSGVFYTGKYYITEYEMTANDIVFTKTYLSTTNALGKNMNYSFAYGSLLWSNKPLKYNGTVLEDYYSYNLTNVDSRLKQHYEVTKIAPDLPIYTYCNLLFGDYVEEEKEKTTYRIEYYFDDILDSSKTEYLSGFVGDKVENHINFENDLYRFYSKDSLILTDNLDTNVLKVYYRSPLYNTDKKPINLDRNKIHFFYTFSDIKSMFPSITFENFTQYEQFVIVLLFNIFYCLFLFFVSYFLLRASFKCWDWMKSWIF